MELGDVKIVSITASDDGRIFGLGEDNKVYRWDVALSQWTLFSEQTN